MAKDQRLSSNLCCSSDVSPLIVFRELMLKRKFLLIRQTWSAEDTCAFVEFNIWCFSEIYIYIYIYCFIWNKLKYAAFDTPASFFYCCLSLLWNVPCSTFKKTWGTRGCGPELCTILFLLGDVSFQNTMPHGNACQYLTLMQMEVLCGSLKPWLQVT